MFVFRFWNLQRKLAEELELQKYTFTPDISVVRDFEARRRRSESDRDRGDRVGEEKTKTEGSIFSRLNAEDKRAVKDAQFAQIRAEMEMEGCTFRPEIFADPRADAR